MGLGVTGGQVVLVSWITGKKTDRPLYLDLFLKPRLLQRGFVVVKCSSFLRWSILFVLLKNRGCPPKILLKRTRGLLNKEIFLFGISAFGVF
jgi:hypothetical protein